MAKDVSQSLCFDDLSACEIERIEAFLFTAGGPPSDLTPALFWRASGRRTKTRAAA